MAHPGGRPPKVTEEERLEIFNALDAYIDRTPDPTIVGFCAYDIVAKKYWITRDNINDWEEFSTLKKRAVQKQEAFLLAGTSDTRINPTLAIFRLKQPQHGFTDRQNIDHTTKGKELPAPILGGVSNITGDIKDEG